MQPRVDPNGLFDVGYRAFLETVARLRDRLHRYCARMTGSILDGEDIMQESLFEAYQKIETLDDASALRSWLFRIAHNRCIDFIRKRRVRERAEAIYAAAEGTVAPVEPTLSSSRRAIERLVIHLPPKERACVLLKDVFDHSLEEIAELVDSTVGGVKAALNRGRTKLAASQAVPEMSVGHRPDPEMLRLLQRYADLFARHDWDGVRALTSADAQLRVSDCFNGRLDDSPYFLEYEKDPFAWTMTVGEIDGETVLLVARQRGECWEPVWPVRIRARGEVIHQITDYYACPWILAAAESVRVGSALFGQRPGVEQ